jgi:hypothetical protein
MVTIKYTGSVLALHGWTMSIPVDPYIKHGFVRESAKYYIQGELPHNIEFSPEDDVFNVKNNGILSDGSVLVVLIHWKVVQE